MTKWKMEVGVNLYDYDNEKELDFSPAILQDQMKRLEVLVDEDNSITSMCVVLVKTGDK